MQKLFLVLREFFSSRFISMIVLLSISLAVLSSGAFSIIGKNINYYITNKFSLVIPPNIIKVSAKPVPKMAMGLFNFVLKKPAGSLLDENTLINILAMKGVKSGYPLMASQIPMQASISIFGLNYRTDLICIGVAYEYISNDIKNNAMKKLWRTWTIGKELPVLVPNILLDAYNNSMAEPNGLPSITEDFAMGRSFQILFGKSSIKTIDGFEIENATIIGFTDKVANICLVIPLTALKYYNKKFKSNSIDNGYMALYVKTEDHKSLLDIYNKIKRMGFIVETERSLSQEIIALKSNIELAVLSITWIITSLSIIAIMFSTIIATLDRVEYYRILRILGASKVFIFFCIIIKYALLGFLGTLIGFYFLDTAVKYLLPNTEVTGFKVNVELDKSLYLRFYLMGVILPVLSTIPAVFKLFIKGMSEE